MWNLRPGVASNYLREVIDDFEAYAERAYLPALDRGERDADLMLAGVRYVATRGVSGREAALYEALTMAWPIRERRELDRACLDAIVQTSEDPYDSARFLSLHWSGDGRVPNASAYVDALRALGPMGNEAVLEELADPNHTPRRLRKLARLLVSMSGERPPEPLGRWLMTSATERTVVLAQWRDDLLAEGDLLPTWPPPAPVGPPWPPPLEPLPEPGL